MSQQLEPQIQCNHKWQIVMPWDFALIIKLKIFLLGSEYYDQFECIECGEIFDDYYS